MFVYVSKLSYNERYLYGQEHIAGLFGFGKAFGAGVPRVFKLDCNNMKGAIVLGKKKKIISAAALTAAAVTGIHVANRLVFFYSTIKERLGCTQDSFYKWRFGNIYYTRCGEGAPLLLIHQLNYASSSYEWKAVVDTLSKSHTVYAIDLLGCGRSDKPKMTYTNYMYVQLINDFVKEVIKAKADVMTSGNAGSLASMACFIEPSLYNRLVFIQPERISETSRCPKANHKALKYLMEIPVIGTLVYNIVSSKRVLGNTFVNDYFYDADRVDTEMIEAFCEGAHLGGASARYLYASVRSHFTDIYIGNAIKQLNHSIYVIGSNDVDSGAVLDEYMAYNPAVETAVIDHTGRLPHMERPEAVTELCGIFLD